MIKIPDTLLSRLAVVGTQRFIRVSKNDKVPIDKAWQKTENLRLPTDPQLIAWLEEGGNYGVVGGHGLIIIDADSVELDQLCQQKLPSTFTTRSPGSQMHHRYYRSNLTKPLRLKDKNGDNVGDIQGKGKQVLGPGSIHPNGGTYEVVVDTPLAYISENTLKEILGEWIVKESIIQQALLNAQTETAAIDITITEVITKYGIKLRSQGDELHGSHPVHGSVGGQNFWVNPAKNVWHCFRCESGGGPLSLIAVIEGIIDCTEAIKGAVRGEKFIRTLNRGKELGLIPDSHAIIMSNGKQMTFNPEDFFSKKEDGTIKAFIPKRLVSKIQEELKFATIDRKSDIYYYDDQKGTWYPTGELIIRATAYFFLSSLAKRYFIEEVVAFIRDTNYISRDKFDHDIHRIPVKNGVLNLNTLTLEPFDPQLYALTHIPVEYSTTATCPKTLQFLNDVAPNDIDTLQEWVGYHLWRTYRYQKCVQLVGEGNNGKSTFLNLVQAMLGHDNVSNDTLQQLITERFAMADLYGKLANIAADISSEELRRTGAFKALTGGDYIRAEMKHQNPFKFLNYAKLSFSANRLPPTPDLSDAFFRRWIVIGFPNKFDDDNCDPHIIEKITTPQELSGFLNWAVEGLRRLRENNHFTKSQSTTELRILWKNLSQPVHSFLEQHTEKNAAKHTPKDILYEKYVEYCAVIKVGAISSRKFTRQIKDIMPTLAEARITVDGVRKDCWMGLELLISAQLSVLSGSNILFKNDSDQNCNKKVFSTLTIGTIWQKDMIYVHNWTLQEKLNNVLAYLKTQPELNTTSQIASDIGAPPRELHNILMTLQRDGVAFQATPGRWRATI